MGTREYTKSHFVYNVAGLLHYVYEARAGTRHNEVCLITKYSFDGSDRISGRLEFEGVWDEAWDLTAVVD